MKKVLIAGILALVVIGCVLAAGCTSIDSFPPSSGTMTEVSDEDTVSDEDIILGGNRDVVATCEANLRGALRDPDIKNGLNKVILAVDLTIHEPLQVKKDFTIDLNGHSITNDGDGCAVCVYSGVNLTIEDTKQSYGPGKIKNDGSDSFVVHVNEGGIFTLNGGMITGGSNDNGGGVYVSSGATFTMNGGQISDNDAEYNGGGVYVAGTFTMNDGSITDNFAEDNGGGVYVSSGGTFTMNDGTISDNLADWYDGGGVYVGKGGVFTMNKGTISGNTGDNCGGGVYVAGTFTMNEGNITGNDADDESGGGVYVASSGIFMMKRGFISENTADDNGGGISVAGTFIMGDDNATVFNTQILKNTAGDRGAGVYVSGTFTLKKGYIQDNIATGSDLTEDGGGVYVGEDGQFEMNDGYIEDNRAKRGGGVFVEGTFTMNGGTIISNHTKSFWGTDDVKKSSGIYVDEDATFIMNGGELFNNDIAKYHSSNVALNGGVLSYEAEVYTLSGNWTVF